MLLVSTGSGLAAGTLHTHEQGSTRMNSNATPHLLDGTPDDVLVRFAHATDGQREHSQGRHAPTEACWMLPIT